MDILIVKLGALGDVINTLPLAVRLKAHFDAKIHWLVAPLSYPLVSSHPSVDTVIVFDKKQWASGFFSVKKQIRNHPFDIVLDLQRILKSGVFTMTARAKRRIGFDKKRCKEMTWLLPCERIPESDPAAHMVYQYLEFADYLGIPDDDIRWDIPVSGNVPDGLPEQYIVLNIGATKPANRWTVEGFSSLANRVREKFGIASVLTGGPEDMEMAKNIVAMNTETINLAGKTSVNELTVILNGSTCVITCDTGPMHLASALGKNVIALFGPSDPARTGPFRGHVIQKNIDCAPCNQRHCDDPVCMKSISSDDVMSHLGKLLY